MQDTDWRELSRNAPRNPQRSRMRAWLYVVEGSISSRSSAGLSCWTCECISAYELLLPQQVQGSDDPILEKKKNRYLCLRVLHVAVWAWLVGHLSKLQVMAAIFELQCTLQRGPSLIQQFILSACCRLMLKYNLYLNRSVELL